MSATQALLERELGRAVLELLEDRGAAEPAVRAAERRALDLVRDIQAVLDDPERSDFDCVEEIAGILARAGIATSRHDFG